MSASAPRCSGAWCCALAVNDGRRLLAAKVTQADIDALKGERQRSLDKQQKEMQSKLNSPDRTTRAAAVQQKDPAG